MNGLKITVSGIEQLAEIAKDIAQKVVLPPVEEIGLLLSDSIKLYRLKNQLDVVTKAEAFLKRKNIKTKKVSLKLLAPLLEDCSLEDDETLKDRWAALLANTVREDSSIHDSVLSKILKDLSSEDIRNLEYIFKTLTTTVTNDSIGILKSETVDVYELRKQSSTGGYSIDNLIRLGLIQMKVDKRTHPHFGRVWISSIGIKLVLCCTWQFSKGGCPPGNSQE